MALRRVGLFIFALLIAARVAFAQSSPWTANTNANGFLLQQLGQGATQGDACGWGLNCQFNNLTISNELTIPGGNWINIGLSNTGTFDGFINSLKGYELNGQPVSFIAPTIIVANDSSVGTVNNTLTKLADVPSKAVRAATTDTGGIVGITTQDGGTTGSATIQFGGTASCIFDGATTAGDYVQISSTTAGACHDAGATYPASGQVIGRVLSTNISQGTYTVDLFSPEISGSTGGTVTLSGDVTGASNANIATQSKSVYELWSNDGVTGTATGKLIKDNGSGQAVTISTADTSGILGICKTGCGTTGTATVQVTGFASGVFDGATTSGDFVCASTTSAGELHDCGTSQPTTTQLIGTVLSTNATGGTYTFDLFPPGEIASLSAPGGGGHVTGGTCTNQVVTAISAGHAVPTCSNVPTGALSGTTTGVVFSFGAVSASQVSHLPVPIAVTWPATFDASNAFVSCSTNPSESDAYTLKCGGTTLATLTVSTSCAASYSTTTGSHASAAGEKCELDAPGTVSGNVTWSVQVTR